MYLKKFFSKDKMRMEEKEIIEPSSAPMPEETLEARIRYALDSISGISYQADVPASTIDSSAHPAAKPIAFMVYKNEHPVLAIAIVKNNTYRSMPVKGTQMLVENRGMDYIRFFRELENRPDYIRSRIISKL